MIIRNIEEIIINSLSERIRRLEASLEKTEEALNKIDIHMEAFEYNAHEEYYKDEKINNVAQEINHIRCAIRVLKYK